MDDRLRVLQARTKEVPLPISSRVTYCAKKSALSKGLAVFVRRTARKLMKVNYKGYRIWAILQKNGKYRAHFYKSRKAAQIRIDIGSPRLEAETEEQTVVKAKEFLDGFVELNEI